MKKFVERLLKWFKIEWTDEMRKTVLGYNRIA